MCIRLTARDQYTASLVAVYLLNSSKEHNEKEIDCTRCIREVLVLSFHCNRTECVRELYLSLEQGYGRNTLILHFVYIAYNLFKGLLIGLSIYSLDL